MEQRKAVHYEIQCEEKDGEWAELVQERPKTEKEIFELRDRARAAYPGEKIRVVKVTTTVMIEEICEERRNGTLDFKIGAREPVHELLQDCD